jgi:very-short-patch-repair endonuclease
MISDSENPRDRARLLRVQCTQEEALLWKHLRAKRFGGFKFRREHRVADQKEQDAARTAYLAEHGYRVIRFWNEQVNREMDDVLEAIYAALTDS